MNLKLPESKIHELAEHKNSTQLPNTYNHDVSVVIVNWIEENLIIDKYFIWKYGIRYQNPEQKIWKVLKNWKN